MSLDAEQAVTALTQQLRPIATQERAVNEKRYLKSSYQHLGNSVPDIRRAARHFIRDHPCISRQQLIDLTQRLWTKDIYELRKLAAVILAERADLLQTSDITLIERLLRDSHTWALVDDISTNLAPHVLEESRETRDRWAKDPDFWIRRASMLSLLPQLRRNTNDWTRFTAYADQMLHEKEFFIQKTIGWILREVSKHSPNLVAQWLTPRAAKASSVTIREAIKYLDPDQKETIAKARKATQPQGRTR